MHARHILVFILGLGTEFVALNYWYCFLKQNNHNRISNYQIIKYINPIQSLKSKQEANKTNQSKLELFCDSDSTLLN